MSRPEIRPLCGASFTIPDNRIASTPVKTLDGLLSKAAYALHGQEDGTGSFTGYRGTAFSALHDLLVLYREV